MPTTIISGKPGVGKSMFLAYIFAKRVIDSGFADWRNCNKELNVLRDGGFNLLEPPPQKHTCFSDCALHIGKRIKSYEVNGFEIGLPNPFFKTKFLPPFAKIFLDEAQIYYDSRISKFLREEVYRWYQFHRHNDYDIYMTCQRLGNIDVNIRAIADKCIVIDSIDLQKNIYGIIEKITWQYRVFNSCDTAEEYMLNCDKYGSVNFGEVITESTSLPVWSYYDTHSKKPTFFLGQTNCAYDYFTEEGYEFTRDSFVEYNNAHYFTAPQGYLKNADYDKMILKTRKGMIA